MSHYCICPACEQKFDRDKIQAVRVGARRYGHATCYPDNTDFIPLAEPKVKKKTKEEDPDLTKLKDYISKLFGDKARWAMINKQLKTYITDNKYSYSGILKSLIYWYEVKGNGIEKSNGAIGM